MKIRELAEKTGLSADTIRFYEKRGLLDQTHVQRQANNYRDYAESAVNRIQLIQHAKRLGFTLGEIQSAIAAWESNHLSAAEKIAILEDKIALIDKQIASMQQMQGYLREKIELVRQST